MFGVFSVRMESNKRISYEIKPSVFGIFKLMLWDNVASFRNDKKEGV